MDKFEHKIFFKKKRHVVSLIPKFCLCLFLVYFLIDYWKLIKLFHTCIIFQIKQTTKYAHSALHGLLRCLFVLTLKNTVTFNLSLITYFDTINRLMSEEIAINILADSYIYLSRKAKHFFFKKNMFLILKNNVHSHVCSKLKIISFWSSIFLLIFFLF